MYTVVQLQTDCVSFRARVLLLITRSINMTNEDEDDTSSTLSFNTSSHTGSDSESESRMDVSESNQYSVAMNVFLPVRDIGNETDNETVNEVIHAGYKAYTRSLDIIRILRVINSHLEDELDLQRIILVDVPRRRMFETALVGFCQATQDTTRHILRFSLLLAAIRINAQNRHTDAHFRHRTWFAYRDRYCTMFRRLHQLMENAITTSNPLQVAMIREDPPLLVCYLFVLANSIANIEYMKGVLEHEIKSMEFHHV